MEPLVYLLVCEGPTDILVIKKIAQNISGTIGRDIVIRELSPQRDATTKRYPEHGWEEVRRWCKLYGKSEYLGAPFAAIFAQKKNWEALVLGSGAEGLIIQVDTDIAHLINDAPPNYVGTNKRSRKRFCEKAVLDWLGLTSKPGKIYFLLSTYSTETWILSTHERNLSVFNDLSRDFDFEAIDNPVDRLIELGYKNYTDTESGRQKLDKNLTIYTRYADKISEELIKVRTECEEAENLCHYFEE